MSSVVLKRKYDMQLPINYVEVEKDEMEYIDGGAEKVNYWWGYAINLSPNECNTTAEYLAGNIGAAAGIVTIAAAVGGPLALPVEVATVIYSVGVGYAISVLKACASNGNGATLSKNYAGYSVNPW